MAFDLDRVPCNLDDAVDMIYESLHSEDIKHMTENGTAGAHDGLGRFIRNAWDLWDQDTHLVSWFKEHYKLIHADDISSVIISSVWAKVRGEEFDIHSTVLQFHEHWKAQGIDPMTMGPLNP